MAGMESTVQDDRSSSLTSEISNMMVGLLAEYTGRGPTKARTIVSKDLVVVLMRDTLTKGERTLVKAGKDTEVLEVRRLFQSAICAAATANVERLTGRKVVGFMSDNHIDPDLAIEAFVLEPEVPATGANGVS